MAAILLPYRLITTYFYLPHNKTQEQNEEIIKFSFRRLFHVGIYLFHLKIKTFTRKILIEAYY